MVLRRVYIVILLIVLIAYLPSPAQPSAFESPTIFNHLTTENGLSHDHINAIYQDKKGFIWIATTHGLNRYDGIQFKIFQHDQQDTGTISDDNVLCIFPDKQDRLWVGTYWGGLCRYDPDHSRFVNYYNKSNGKHVLPENVAYSAIALDSSRIMIAQEVLTILDCRQHTSSTIPLPINTWSYRQLSFISPVFGVYYITKDSYGIYWLAGEAGLVQYYPSQNKLVPARLDQGLNQEFFNHSSSMVTEDIDHNIWIASTAGLWFYNRQTGRYTSVRPKTGNLDVFTSIWIRAIYCDNDNTVWIGTENGLYHYYPETGTYRLFVNDPNNNSSLSDNNISCITKDRQGILWIGTANGVNAIYPTTSRFPVFQANLSGATGIRTNITRGSFRDDHGNYWIGTQQGLQFVDAKNNTVSMFTPPGPWVESTIYSVMPILQQDEHTIWVATWGNGLQLFDFHQKKFLKSFQHLDKDTIGISSNYIKDMCFDKQGNLWLATWNGGLEKLDTRTYQFYHHTKERSPGLRSNYISKVCFDGERIWAGTRWGIAGLKADNEFETFHLNTDSLNELFSGASSLTAGSPGELFAGTFKGLYRFNTKTHVATKVEANGMSSVHGMLFKSPRQLWIASGDGLKQYDEVADKMNVYTLKDGLPATYFPLDSYFFLAKDGEIFLNSDKGLIHFYPEQIFRNEIPPVLSFTSIKIANQELQGKGDISKLTRLNLSHEENYITFDFAALNYINPSQNQYKYKLDGVDNDWVNAGNKNEAIYTNLSPGDYVFHVKASNDAAIWNEQGIQLSIHISRPWWKTWWFYTVCSLLLIGGLYTMYRVRINRIMAEQSLRNRIARDLHDDIGSTLSGIKLFSGMALQKLEQEDSSATPIIKRIGERSETMIDAMSDIVWSISPKNDSMEDLVSRMRAYTAEMLEPKNIRFEFMASPTDMKTKLEADKRKEVYLIFKEAVNNLVKHSSATRARIELSQSGKEFLMTIEDNGMGIDRVKEKAGNGLRNMQERADKINADLKILKLPTAGTRVSLRFS